MNKTEHEQFYDELTGSRDNLQLRACAGSGKTFAVLEGAKRTGQRNQTVLAFSKAIEVEISAKIADQGIPLRAATTHSAGLQMISAEYSRVPSVIGFDAEKFDREAVRKALRATAGDLDDLPRILKLLSMAKNSCAEPESIDERWVSRTAARNRMVLDDAELAARILNERLAASLDRASWRAITFDDMLYVPAMLQLPHPRPPKVLYVDEAQDLNPCQHAMLINGFDGARTIVVGDEFQSIFAWRGAHESSLDEMQRLLNQRILKLTYTRRCPVRVVEDARKICPDINAMPGAGFGSVEAWGQLEHAPNAMALARRNAPLFGSCMSMLKQGLPARINGRGSAKAIIGLFERVCKSSRVDKLDELGAGVDDYIKQLRSRARSRLDPEDVDAYMSDQIDTAQCVLAVASGASALNQIPALIDGLCSAPDGMLFSTVHRAKGMEAPRVYLLEPDVFTGENQQERNVLYVAVTRALESLVYCGETPAVIAGRREGHREAETSFT